MCPPNYDTMADAVDAVVADKFGPDGIYTDEALFARIYRGEFGAAYLEEANDYSADVIACTRDICTYIYETHGRFPAHADTIHVPGVWLQTHHLENAYYEKYFRNGMTEAHELHDERWHPDGRGTRDAQARGRPGVGPAAARRSAACGGGSEENTSSEPSDSLDADAPEAEDPNAEEAPDKSGGDAVAVELPGLPIGGNTEVVSDTLQCVDVGWTEPPDLPDWIGITVTGVTFTPAEGFTAVVRDRAPAGLRRAWPRASSSPVTRGATSLSRSRVNPRRCEADDVLQLRGDQLPAGPGRAVRGVPRRGRERGRPVDRPRTGTSEFETGEGETARARRRGRDGEGETDPENTEESSPDSTDERRLSSGAGRDVPGGHVRQVVELRQSRSSPRRRCSAPCCSTSATSPRGRSSATSASTWTPWG